MKPSAARRLALEALGRIRRTQAFAAPVIAELIDTSDLDRRDRNFAATLVKGVVTYEGVLDETLDYFFSHPRRVEPQVRDALRIAAYELLILRSPTHAAVNEGVGLVATVSPAARRLANAVLRRVAEAAGSFPYGDPAVDDAAAARYCALPLWLFTHIAAERGRDEALAFGRASLNPAPVYVAVRDAGVLETLTGLGAEPEKYAPIAYEGTFWPPHCYRLTSAAVLVKPEVQALLNEGALIVADGASQLVAAMALNGAHGHSLLEVGCGRGTKTLLLCQDAQSRWGSLPERFVASDINADKLELAEVRVHEAGIDGVEFLCADGAALDEYFGATDTFDTILVDAPCTGLGTIRRHPEIRWRLRPETIVEAADLGLRLLTSAAQRLQPGGVLTYATCTITRAENEDVLERFLAGPAGHAFEVVPTFGAPVATTLPYPALDAHTLFRLRRR